MDIKKLRVNCRCIYRVGPIDRKKPRVYCRCIYRVGPIDGKKMRVYCRCIYRVGPIDGDQTRVYCMCIYRVGPIDGDNTRVYCKCIYRVGPIDGKKTLAYCRCIYHTSHIWKWTGLTTWCICGVVIRCQINIAYWQISISPKRHTKGVVCLPPAIISKKWTLAWRHRFTMQEIRIVVNRVCTNTLHIRMCVFLVHYSGKYAYLTLLPNLRQQNIRQMHGGVTTTGKCTPSLPSVCERINMAFHKALKTPCEIEAFYYKYARCKWWVFTDFLFKNTTQKVAYPHRRNCSFSHCAQGEIEHIHR